MISSPTKPAFLKTTDCATSFRKTAQCPASATLLLYRLEKLSRRSAVEVRQHLGACEFCNAELPLLAHHTPARRRTRPPEIPMNLRILAESLLSHKVS
jgi:hypothetical protein